METHSPQNPGKVPEHRTSAEAQLRSHCDFEGPLFAGSINPGLLAAKAKAWLAFEDSSSDIQKAPKQMNLRE